jgi:hypothetical protein
MEDFKNLFPANFRELFSFFSFLISIIFSFISLNKSYLEHCLRMAAILFIVSLALFANNGYCYFGAIFIVATAVTQLDFLQNLAAIIRGSKEYFDYKKESKSTQEVENELEREAAIIENTPVEDEIKNLQFEGIVLNFTNDNKELSFGQFAFLVEEYTFKFFEKKFKRPIQRYVRVISSKFRTDFDGILSLGDSDVIFEIKTTRRGIFPTTILKSTIDRLIKLIENYQEATNRNASLRIVLVGDFKESYKARIISQIPELAPQNNKIQFIIDFYSFTDIGLDIEQLNFSENEK